MITFWLMLGAIVIVAAGIVVGCTPSVVKGWADDLRHRRSVSRLTDRVVEQRDHLADGLGTGFAYLLIVSASIPPIVCVCFAAGMLVTHAPVWAHDVSVYQWFARNGPDAPTLLRFLRGVSRLGEWTPVLVISAVAALGLIVVAKRRRWLGPVLVGVALVVERDVQLVIGWFVHQAPVPTTLASFPSGGVARVLAVYGFIVYLYLRLRPLNSWHTLVLAWTLVALFAFLMGYARAALLLHWPFDIPGGMLLGVLLLWTMTAASSVFIGSYFPSRNASPDKLDPP